MGHVQLIKPKVAKKRERKEEREEEEGGGENKCQGCKKRDRDKKGENGLKERSEF